MKTFEMKTVIHFGDNALDRLAELPYKKVPVSYTHLTLPTNSLV